MTKDISTLVEDIHSLFDPNVDQAVDLEALRTCLQSIGEALEGSLMGRRDTKGKLRLSQVGKPDRQVWLEYRGEEGEELRPEVYLKFLFGHMYEALILFLAKQAGHEVRGEQDELSVEGILGHRDAVIDNVLVDVKSAASFSFDKFSDGRILTDDPFGYLLQLSTYLESSDDCIDREAGWLVVDKQHGKIALTRVPRDKLPDARSRVKRIKEVVASNKMPEICYLPVPDGKGGNHKLATGCSYCKFKHKCYPSLRTFLYSNGPRFLTSVGKVPKVPELMKDGSVNEAA